MLIEQIRDLRTLIAELKVDREQAADFAARKINSAIACLERGLGELVEAGVSDLRCEVCGAPPTSVVRDMVRNPVLETGSWHYKADGPPHFFCDEHNRLSSISEGLPLLGGKEYNALAEARRSAERDMGLEDHGD